MFAVIYGRRHFSRVLQLLREVIWVYKKYPYLFLMLRLSGPTELLFLLCCIASWTWVVVRVIVCLGSL